MTHLVAIFGAAIVCGLWVWIQRASGAPEGEVHAGSCGACGQRKPKDDCLGDACPNKQAELGFSRIGSLLAVLLVSSLALAGMRQSMVAEEAAPITVEQSLMGTRWVIRVIPEADMTSDQIEAAIQGAFTEVARVETVMSEWIPTSPISLVNSGSGSAVPAPQELVAIVTRAIAISEQTDGAFDVSWRPLGDVWQVGDDAATVPEAEVVNAALGLVEYSEIGLTDDTILLPRPGMALGLGGIAKGYGVDRAAQVLREAGLQRFYIDGGGDIYVGGDAGGRDWHVGVRDPRGGPTDLIAVVNAHDRAVVTSGDYERYSIIDGRRYHHIVDPRTGYPAEGCRSVTVVGPSAEWADAMATAVFVLGHEAGLRMINQIDDAEALVIDDDGQVWPSNGFEAIAEVSRP